MTVDPRQLLGSWRLVDVLVRNRDGTERRPFGPNASGIIVYSPDGSVTAIVEEEGRFLAAGAVSEAEAARSWRSLFAYTGDWSLDGNVVRHTVRHAHDPRMTGIVLERSVLLNGNDLTLSGKQPGGTDDETAFMIWKRRSSP